LCPTGWHVPSEQDFINLTNYLENNGYGYQGSGDDIAKSLASKNYWNYFSTSGTVGNNCSNNNSSNFNALPGGYRGSFGGFSKKGDEAAFWSNSKSTHGHPMDLELYYDEDKVSITILQAGFGASVRCIKD
jgi:uncharacterized protein (TIGR02145 family)